LAEQAKILLAEAEENNLTFGGRWGLWHTCSLCEQGYHGVVSCALGWACWKTYVGRPEGAQLRSNAMMALGNGLSEADLYEDASSAQEALLAMLRRGGGSEDQILALLTNLSNTYTKMGRLEQALQMDRDVYNGRAKLYGEEHEDTLRAANNYAMSLKGLQRFEEARSLLRKKMHIARRALGESDNTTLRMRKIYAQVLYADSVATLDDVREAVTTLEDTTRIARRICGSSHPFAISMEYCLQEARVALRASLLARKGEVDSLLEAVDAMTPPGGA